MNTRTCAQMIVHELLIETQPGYRERRLEVEAETRRLLESGRALEAVGELFTIDVIVHVVHRTDEENVSDEQVQSQIDVLNRDFRALQRGLRERARPVEVARRPTRRSSSRSATSRRIETKSEGFGADDSVKREVPPVDPEHKLNLWVCSLSGGLLGYAQFPGGPEDTDGVVVLNQAFGTTGTATAPFDGGRTAVHEVGHFLNLRHIWGDRNDCTGNDFVADTPKAAPGQHRQADVPAHHVRQRPARRHVHELHGLRRRRRDVHVHARADRPHERGAGGPAEYARLVTRWLLENAGRRRAACSGRRATRCRWPAGARRSSCMKTSRSRRSRPAPTTVPVPSSELDDYYVAELQPDQLTLKRDPRLP